MNDIAIPDMPALLEKIRTRQPGSTMVEVHFIVCRHCGRIAWVANSAYPASAFERHGWVRYEYKRKWSCPECWKEQGASGEEETGR